MSVGGRYGQLTDWQIVLWEQDEVEECSLICPSLVILSGSSRSLIVYQSIQGGGVPFHFSALRSALVQPGKRQKPQRVRNVLTGLGCHIDGSAHWARRRRPGG